QAEAALTSGDAGFADRVRERVIGAIRQSEKATVFEDLERYKRLTRHLRLALIWSLVLLVWMIVGVAGRVNQGYGKQQWTWYTAGGPFLAGNTFRQVPAPGAGGVLKPGARFRKGRGDQGKAFGPEMIVVPAGAFVMGSPPSERGHL